MLEARRDGRRGLRSRIIIVVAVAMFTLSLGTQCAAAQKCFSLDDAMFFSDLKDLTAYKDAITWGDQEQIQNVVLPLLDSKRLVIEPANIELTIVTPEDTDRKSKNFGCVKIREAATQKEYWTLAPMIKCVAE